MKMMNLFRAVAPASPIPSTTCSSVRWKEHVWWECLIADARSGTGERLAWCGRGDSREDALLDAVRSMYGPCRLIEEVLVRAITTHAAERVTRQEAAAW